MKMKNLLLTSITFILMLTSCQDLADIGKNPNNVSETPPHLLLTQIQSNAFQVKGKSPLYASRMIVSTAGESDLQYYKWNRGSYGDYDHLRNVTKMIEEAKRTNKTEYEALGKFFRAYYFYNLSLTFGDIPYSEALKGESDKVYTPKYDRQKAVFQGILKELKEANDILQDDDVIEGDIIYAGDASKWRRLINSFRLKVLMTLSHKAGSGDLNVINRFADIANNQPLIESNAENGQMEFYDQIGSQYGEYNDSDYGSGLYMDSTFIRRLQDRKDPRLFLYCDRTKNAKEQGLAIDDFNAYEGGKPVGPYRDVEDKAGAGKVSKVDLRYTTNPTAEPHVLLGYSEVQLILAEARVRGWIQTSDAKTYYNNAVKADFEFYKKNVPDYAAYVNAQTADTYLQGDLVNLDKANTADEKIQRILMQKYLRSFLQGGWTVYFEQLRTGYPHFMEPESGAPPKRWIYPQSEYQNNNQNVSEAITRQFGAGNDKIRATPWWLK